ncbi:MAG: hypothetical protein U0174_21650 [Polyangiaceae bacterium]
MSMRRGSRHRIARSLFRVHLLALALLLLTYAGHSFAGGEPTLKWQTLITPHFRITFYSGEREIAEHVADIAETQFDEMTKDIGWKPSERTEIALVDYYESANGFASAVPYNAITLYVTAPDDLSPLGDVDDWFTELVTHEYTHTLHVDQARGIPALINFLMGRTWFPNQIQPRWLLEGFAVYQESARTSGGRLRSPLWEMYIRADVLENNFATLDQVSHSVRRWPQGNLWYLYGSHFLQWIADTYGRDALIAMIKEYGKQPVPWGINRAIRRVTGKTFEELYPAWHESLRTRFEAQKAEIRREGIREGKRLTNDGMIALYPRWVPKGAYPGREGQLLYLRDDAHSRMGIYALPLDRDKSGAVTKSYESQRSLLFRTSGDTPVSFAPDGSMVFASYDAYKSIWQFSDLQRHAPGQVDVTGQEEKRTRLTEGFRAAEPTVSPDGRHVAFVTNHRGTRVLQIADLLADRIGKPHSIVPSLPLEQAFTPRFAPDNVHLAYSAWSTGGFRDIRYVDVRDGTFVEVTHDRAMDGGCSFTPDGKYILFHSDRSGVPNVYAFEIAKQKLWKVTNVVNGAFYPEVSPDGLTLAYTGYTKSGFDMFAMAFDPTTFTEAKPYVDMRPSMPHLERKGPYEVVPYNAWSTLAPRKYSIQITPGSYGQMAVLSAKGSDIAGIHNVAATLYSEFERPDLQLNLGYTYGQLPFDVSLSGFRSIAPRQYSLGAEKISVDTESIGVDTAVSIRKGRMFDGQDFSLGYAFARVGTNSPVAVKPDPYAVASAPSRGFQGFLHAGYSFSNAESFLYSVGPERGLTFAMDATVTHPALASEFRGYSARTDVTGYIPLPWARHHVLALHTGAGMSGGSFPGKGQFYVGSFVDQAVLDSIRNVSVQSGLVLRGYEPVAVAGDYFSLWNAEYRFPIVNVDRGPSTVPIFLNRISGAFFLDYGTAFNVLADAEWKTGTGGELWVDMLLGYNLSMSMRFGYASGLASKGIEKFYWVAALPY